MIESQTNPTALAAELALAEKQRLELTNEKRRLEGVMASTPKEPASSRGGLHVTKTKREEIQRLTLCELATSACGTADGPTLIHLVDEDGPLVLEALEALVGLEEAERVGVAFRITDKGRARLNGGRS